MKSMTILLMIGIAVVCSGDRLFAQSAGQDQRPRSDRSRSVQEPPVDIGAETASHEEIAPLPVKFERLSCLRLAPNGNLAAGDSEAEQIKIISPSGQLLSTIRPGFGPEAINFSADGTMYCGGAGRLAKVDAANQILKTVDVPTSVETRTTTRNRHGNHAVRVSGIAVSGDAVFVAFGSGWSLGSKSKLFRFGLDLETPKLLAEGLRGCCQRCDIIARDGRLYLAENAAHRIVCYDRDGRILDKWGAKSRTELAGFGSCCNPMNLAFNASGTLYTSESGLGRVKRYTIDGKFLGLVGYVGVARFNRAGGLAASCSNIAIAVTPKAERVYVMDLKGQLIRVLQKKG